MTMSYKLANLALIGTFFILTSCLVSAEQVNSNPIPNPQRPSPIVSTRSILNGSFELPVVTNYNAEKNNSVTGSPVENIAGGNIPEGYNSPTFPIIWQNTDKGLGAAPGNYNYKDAIEVWRGVATGNGGPTATSGKGKQYAEINGSDNASLYQDVCVIPGDTVKWSLLHSARMPGWTNIMQVSITNPTAWSNSKTPPATKLYNSGDVSTAYSEGWKAKQGTWVSTVGEPRSLRFAFQATQGSYGSPSLGNFIDDVKLNLSPVLDFLPTGTAGNVNLASTKEGNPGAEPPYYYLSLRINGEMSTSGSVKINLRGLNSGRDFRLGTPLRGNTALAGLTATKNQNQITLNIPTGIYDPNVPLHYIHIPIDFSDTVKMRNDKLVFTLADPTGGGITEDDFTLNDLSLGSSNCATQPRIEVPVLLRDDDYVERV